MNNFLQLYCLAVNRVPGLHTAVPDTFLQLNIEARTKAIGTFINEGPEN